jgi:hypothetical protein
VKNPHLFYSFIYVVVRVQFSLKRYTFSFFLSLDVTVAGEGLQNIGLCSALEAFEQGGIFFVPHLLFSWFYLIF